MFVGCTPQTEVSYYNLSREGITMDRREALASFGAITLAALADAAVAQEHDHQHMHDAPKYKALTDAAADCVQKGEACVAHCTTLLGQGEKEMAACQSTAQQTIAICAALQQLANLGSPHLGKVAKVAMDICKDCEDECRKHEKKHSVCKDCGDACAACYKQCKAVAA
jgi:Cys-rich four helix bundle protein (predicted Tat secretion target)